MRPLWPCRGITRPIASSPKYGGKLLSISLATVYNNLRLFVEHGLLREVSPHASTLLVEGNLEPHHHLVCTRCKSVHDVEGDFINTKSYRGERRGASILREPLVEVFGLCRRCSTKK